MSYTIFPIFCQDHPTRLVEKIDSDFSAEKALYCLECFLKQKDGHLLYERCPTVWNFIKETATSFQKTKEKIPNLGEIPLKFSKQILEKAEKLNKLNGHINKQKEIANEFFSGLSKSIINEIEHYRLQCLDLLDEQVAKLADTYDNFEEQLREAYPSPEDLQKLYPSREDLGSQYETIQKAQELETFIKDLKNKLSKNVEANEILYQDKEIKRAYFKKLMKKVQKEENKLPVIQFKFDDVDRAKEEVKPKLNEFLDKLFEVEKGINSNLAKFHGVIDQNVDLEFEIKKLLPKNYKVPPKFSAEPSQP